MTLDVPFIYKDYVAFNINLHELYDIDGDGIPEIVIFFSNPYGGSGGYNVLYWYMDNEYRAIADFPRQSPDFFVNEFGEFAVVAGGHGGIEFWSVSLENRGLTIREHHVLDLTSAWSAWYQSSFIPTDYLTIPNFYERPLWQIPQLRSLSF